VEYILRGLHIVIDSEGLHGMTLPDSSQSSLLATNAARFGCPCASVVTSPLQDPGKRTL
jgi:hypothetical protein